MSYIGTAWMNEELQQAIAGAEDDQHAFALAATAIEGTIRAGLGKISAEVSGLVGQQAATAEAMRDVADAIREVNVRPEDVALEPPPPEPELLPEPPGGGAAGMVNQARKKGKK